MLVKDCRETSSETNSACRMQPRAGVHKQRGITLVELIVTIIVMGILATMVTGFIAYGTRIYVDSTDWQQELGNVRFASQRLSLDLQNAVPGTVNVTQNSISFRTADDSARYISAPEPGNLDQVFAYSPACCTDSSCDGCIGGDFILLDGYGPVTRTIQTAQCQNVNCAQVRFSLDSDLPSSGPYSVGQRYFISSSQVTWQISGENVLRNNVLMGQGIENSLSDCDLSNVNDEDCPFLQEPSNLLRNNIVRMQWLVDLSDQQQLFVQEVQLEHVP